MQMHIVLLFVVLFSVYQGATSRTTTARANPTRSPTTTRAHPTQPPTKKPTTKAPTALKDITISVPNQIPGTGSDKNKYFHTQKELNVEIKKKTATRPVPSGKVTFYKGNDPLGSKTLVDGKAKYTISNIPNQFQGAHTITFAYSGDKVYKKKTQSVALFFFTIPKNGNYLINGNQSTPGKTVTFFSATRHVWNTQNQLPTNIDFYGWAKPATSYQCTTKFNVKVSTEARQVYDFTGVIAVKTIGTQGVASSTKIEKVVIVDTRKKAQGTGKVVASFCASAV